MLLTMEWMKCISIGKLASHAHFSQYIYREARVGFDSRDRDWRLGSGNLFFFSQSPKFEDFTKFTSDTRVFGVDDINLCTINEANFYISNRGFLQAPES